MGDLRSEKANLYGSSILKAARILDYLASGTDKIGVSKIAEGTGYNKATVYKILETLQHIRYVEKTDDSHYSLGIGLFKLAHAAEQRFELAELAMSALKRLNEQTNETIHLGVLDGDQIVYIAKLESSQTVRMHSRVGNTSPLYCTGIGKAILSTFPDDDLKEYANTTRFHRYTDNTITNAPALLLEVERIRKSGYSFDDCEHEQDVRCVAVPLVFNGQLYGAISISAPSYRINENVIPDYLKFLKSANRQILEGLHATT